MLKMSVGVRNHVVAYNNGTESSQGDPLRGNLQLLAADESLNFMETWKYVI